MGWSLNKVANAFYRSTAPRVYVDSASQFIASGGITLSAWKGWSTALTVRAINPTGLDGLNPSIVASGHAAFDLSASRQVRRGIDVNFAAENFANRGYYETQNYFVSRLLAKRR